MTPGPRNLITDVGGILVGNAADDKLRSGVSAIVCENPAVAAVHVMGGAPGTRETDLLAPENLVDAVDAVVLSGGSAFGLDAGAGVQAWLRQQGHGFKVGNFRVPVVPGAILFDLANGGDKNWGRYAPYRELGFSAAASAGPEFALGTDGAGFGATTATCKGGLGSASAVLSDGSTLGALVAVNAVGSATIGDTGHFWAAPFEENGEFGGLGLPAPFPVNARELRFKLAKPPEIGENTTLAVIATDAVLTKAQAKRLAINSHDGFARALWPAHTPFDGDLVFALATGVSSKIPADGGMELYAQSAAVIARAIARAVHAATPMAGDLVVAWSAKFGEFQQ